MYINIITKDQYTLYCLKLLEHNKFIFLLLNETYKYFLEKVLEKMEISFELVLLYSEYNKQYNKRLNCNKRDSNYDYLFPEEKYNYNILTEVVYYFNKLYDIEAVSVDKNGNDNINKSNFDKVYMDFLKYYDLTYEIMKKKNELNNSNFKKYHDVIKKNNNLYNCLNETNNSGNSNENNNFYNTMPIVFDIKDTQISTRLSGMSGKSLNSEFDFTKIENEQFMHYDPTGDDNTFINYDNININNNNLTETYLLFYCSTLNFSFIINKIEFEVSYKTDEIESYFSKNLKIEFVKEIKIHDNENIEQIKSLFNNNCVESRESLETKILFYEDVYKKENGVISIDSVKRFINTMYIITDDKEHKVKSSELLNKISKHVIGTTSNIGVKNKISKMLNEIGLKKFRLSDGYYFYGLKVKHNKEYFNNHELIKSDFDDIYRNLIEERKEIIKPL